jgi:hypothetical protein
VTEPEKSMDDTIRDTLRSLKEKGAEIAPETPTTDVPESPEEKAQRIRDEQGRFAKPTEPTEAAPLAPAAPVTVPIELQRLGLRKDEAEEFAKAPKLLQDALLRRSEEMFKGVESYRSKAQFADTMQSVIAPHMATINGLGVTPEVAINELMQADARLRQGDVAFFLKLADDYGFDKTQLAAYFGGEQVPQQPQLHPMVSQLQQQVQALTGHFEQQKTQEKQAAEQALNSEIATFAADPKHSHFEKLKPHMSALLQAGQAASLADAYEQARFAHPETRAEALAEQQAIARSEAAKKAQAAKAAASVNTRPRAALPTSAPIGSMDETIKATYRRLTGGG